MLPDELLLKRARDYPQTRKGLQILALELPKEDAELDGLLTRAIEAREPEIFTNLMLAAMAGGRKPDAQHLARAGALLLNLNAFGMAVHHAGGDVGAACVEAVRTGHMGGDADGAALAAAGVWGKRQNPPMIPAGLMAAARLLARRERYSIWVQQCLMGLLEACPDPGLKSVLLDFNEVIPPEAGANLLAGLIDAVEKEPLANVSDKMEHTIASGFTMRRAVERIGRNDPCPCGSGKKYKKCCLEKDLERLQHSSAVEGMTQEELRLAQERFLTPHRLQSMPSYELARLDPLKVPPELHSQVIRQLVFLEEHVVAISFLEKVGYREELAEAIELLLLDCVRTADAPALRRLVAWYPAGSGPLPMEFSIQFFLDEDPGRRLERINQKVLDGLRQPETDKVNHVFEVALALLKSPLAPLGIVLARGLIAHSKSMDAWMLSERLLAARDQLDLSPDDPSEKHLDEYLVAERNQTPDTSEELNAALDRVLEKSEEIRTLQQKMEELRRELARRETPKAIPLANPSPSAAPAPAAVAVVASVPAEASASKNADPALRELRRKVDALRGALTERHTERNQLRRELEQTRTALESLRKEQAAVEAEEEPELSQWDEDQMLLAEETFSIQPVRLMEFPRKFNETLRALPRGVARAVVSLVGRLAAGEVSAFRGTKRLRLNREIWRQRVGAEYRLLFRLHSETLEVVDLIHRRDLERRIKSLM